MATLQIQKNIPLRDKNTFKIGGVARFYCEPLSAEELIEALDCAAQQHLPVLLLGKGSNLLVSDSGWPGMVINTSVNLRELCWDGPCVYAGAGVLLDDLIVQSVKSGFSGMEKLSGIPGTIGGAVVMNAGAFDTCIADTITEALILDTVTLTKKLFSKQDLKLGYRSSAVKDSSLIVLSARFCFKQDNPEQLLTSRHEILRKRTDKQPLDYPNCGSVFKRPPGAYAGTLIEQCGLKGFRSGSVMISEKHANFIVNLGNGSAHDVRTIICTVQQKVFEKTGFYLEPEVIFVGDFDQPLFKPAL